MEETNMADAGPPVALIAFGLILWLAVDVTLAGLSVHTVGLILTLAGILWLAIELLQARPRRTATVVREEPVVRERELY